MTLDPFLLADTIRRKERELYELRGELARRQAPHGLPAGEFMALRCRLQGISVAIPALQIREVVQMAALTCVPDAPAWLAGMLALGPEHIPVFDLSARSSGEARAHDPSDFIVLADAHSGACGLIVDTIDGLVALDAAKLTRPGPEVPFGPHVLGLCRVAAESVILLSVTALSVEDFSPEAVK